MEREATRVGRPASRLAEPAASRLGRPARRLRAGRFRSFASDKNLPIMRESRKLDCIM
jgi:hypothetical protein